MIVHSAKVFTVTPDVGNLAGVVLNAEGMQDGRRQEIARLVNASETAFVERSDKATFKVRWFTPNNEVGICIHATVAALNAVIKSGEDLPSRLTIETKNAILQVVRDGTRIFVNVPAYRVLDHHVDSVQIADALGISRQAISGPVKIIQIYEDREIMIPVVSMAVLKSLRPSVTDYSALCKANSSTGISIFAEDTLDTSLDVHLREFAPLYGYLEDPLCGMASGCILKYLRSEGRNLSSLKVEQGAFCNTNGTIYVRHDDESGIWVGGECCFAPPIVIKE